MKEVVNGKTKPKEVVKGNSNDFVKKAKAADKKSVFKHVDKKTNKKPNVKTENSKSGSDKKEPPKVKKSLTCAQIAEKKYGVESTWRPFESFFNKNKETEKTNK